MKSNPKRVPYSDKVKARVREMREMGYSNVQITEASHRRKVEVPQYSQVGNAVPPLMAQAIGELLVKLLTDD